MKLASNWKRIVRKSYAFKWNIAGTVLGSIALGLPYLYGEFEVSPEVFVAILTGINMAAGFVRILDQPALRSQEDE